jgi:hypothetical protein
MLSVGWFLGIFFFIFIFAAIGFILAIKTKAPPSRASSEAVARGGAQVRLSNDTASHIRWAYRIERDAQVYVDYPFGLRVVFSDEAPRYAEARRGFQESDYHRWSVPDADPHLIVQHGAIEYAAEEPEPVVRLELRCAPGLFEPMQAAIAQPLRRNQETVYSFWLNPRKEHIGSLMVVFSRVARDGQASRELATVPLSIPIENFPIRLR